MPSTCDNVVQESHEGGQSVLGQGNEWKLGACGHEGRTLRPPAAEKGRAILELGPDGCSNKSVTSGSRTAPEQLPALLTPPNTRLGGQDFR